VEEGGGGLLGGPDLELHKSRLLNLIESGSPSSGGGHKGKVVGILAPDVGALYSPCLATVD